jgi:hypothetical protein
MRKKTKRAFEIVSLKLNPADAKRLRGKAKRFADSNLSAWLRHSSLRYVPRKGEKIGGLADFRVNKKKR